MFTLFIERLALGTYVNQDFSSLATFVNGASFARHLHLALGADRTGRNQLCICDLEYFGVQDMASFPK